VTSIRIPFGPQHPALDLESIHFTFEVDGEHVVSVAPRLGYMHRGIERLAQDRTYLQDLYLVERVCGLCSQAHTICYAQAVEDLLGLELPARARYLRTILAELERIQNHFMWLGVTAHEMGFETLFMHTWRDREVVLNILEEITGKRVNYGFNTIGGLRRDVTDRAVSLLRAGLDHLEARTKYYQGVCTSERTILKRTVDVGILRPADAVALCAVGPTARASGVKQDIRADDPYAAYDDIPFTMATQEGCDVASRIWVRLDELLESIAVIRSALETLPGGDVRVRAPRHIPAGEVVSRVEAPRGENIHYLRGDGGDKPRRLKIRAPTLANLLSLTRMFVGMNIADIPLIIAGIDPCIACAERMAFIDVGHQAQWMWSQEDVRRHALAWYREP
jgi:Ni,Fe-hydrogenase III large subunit